MCSCVFVCVYDFVYLCVCVWFLISQEENLNDNMFSILLIEIINQGNPPDQFYVSGPEWTKNIMIFKT